MDAHQAAAWLQERIDRAFDEDHVTVEVSDQIVAQALAGANRVRFRADARFSERQLRLLEVHEVYVHVATTLNGRRQPVLTFLDVYRWFIDERGHTPQAAYADAMRVLRGSLPDAGPYPKDLAYNKGFIQVYDFLSVAIVQGRIYRIGLLSRAYAEGLFAPPCYLPPHFADLAGLGSWLAYSRFLNQLDLPRIEKDYAELL